MPLPLERKTDYECPRCGLYTDRKSSIQRHFSRKKLCTPLNTEMNIELTDKIKNLVLLYKKYMKPTLADNTATQTTIQNNKLEPDNPLAIVNSTNNNINQQINSNNTIYNYIVNLDTIAKHNELLSFKNAESIDFDGHVDMKYEKAREKLTRNRTTIPHDLEEQQFIDMVHDVTLSKNENLTDMCVFYNQHDNRIFISTGDGKWDEKSCDEGTKTILYALVDYHLQSYEISIIRKLESGASGSDYAVCMKALEDYYRFIASFNIHSSLTDKNDTQVMYNTGDARCNNNIPAHDVEYHRIIDKYTTMYRKIADDISASQRKTLCKRVLDEIRTTTKKNLRELNNTILDIIGSTPKDEDTLAFQKKLMTAPRM
jgi:hypothetical protein